ESDSRSSFFNSYAMLSGWQLLHKIFNFFGLEYFFLTKIVPAVEEAIFARASPQRFVAAHKQVYDTRSRQWKELTELERQTLRELAQKTNSAFNNAYKPYLYFVGASRVFRGFAWLAGWRAATKVHAKHNCRILTAGKNWNPKNTIINNETRQISQRWPLADNSFDLIISRMSINPYVRAQIINPIQDANLYPVHGLADYNKDLYLHGARKIEAFLVKRLKKVCEQKISVLDLGVGKAGILSDLVKCKVAEPKQLRFIGVNSPLEVSMWQPYVNRVLKYASGEGVEVGFCNFDFLGDYLKRKGTLKKVKQEEKIATPEHRVEVRLAYVTEELIRVLKVDGRAHVHIGGLNKKHKQLIRNVAKASNRDVRISFSDKILHLKK
ncbi:MAG: hypothetical protein R6U54_02580, partial [Candidatus Omnitrophota bacterium]